MRGDGRASLGLGSGQPRPVSGSIFQAVLDAAPDAIIAVDRDGRIVLANKQTEALFGHLTTDLIGERVEFLVPKSSWPVHPAHREKYFSRPRTRPMGAGLELAGLKADGTEFPAEISLSSIETDEGILALASIRDVTDRKRAEATVQAMLDAAPDAIVGVRADGIIIMANIQTEALFGYERSALLGQPVELLVPDSIRDLHPSHRDGYFRGPRTRPMGVGLSLAGRRFDGTEFPAEISLSSIETEEGTVALAAIRDVTDRRRAEAKVQAMLDAAPDAMVGVDRDGFIVMANIQTEVLFGYDHETLIGAPIDRLVPERVAGIHPTHRANFFREPRTRPMGEGLDLGGRRSDGTEFPAEISLSSIDTEEGTVALAAIRDVTDRKRVAIEMQEAREAADHASEALRRTNDELQSFSYAVAHDLRAPLRAIDGFSRALADDLGDTLGEAAQDSLDRVRRNVHGMAEMIDGLLGLSRVTRASVEIADVDLSALVEESVADLHASEPDRRVDVIIPEGLSARADAQLLRVLVGNLVANAWKFTAPQETATIEFGSVERDGRNVFFVRDDGVGFDGRYADKLFAPFQRLHRAEDFPGSGIGLATVDRIVRRHGGGVWAESEIGGGATFFFTVDGEP